MTLKEFINKALDIAEELHRQGNHEGYQKAMEIIAGAIYEAQAI